MVYNFFMDYKAVLGNLNAYWNDRKARLSKEEIKHLSDKDSRQGKLVGVFTRNYWKRGKLIQSSEIAYGYVFKQYQTGIKEDIRHPIWVLFSVEGAVNDDPKILERCALKILALEPKACGKTHRKIAFAVKDDMAQVSYMKVPQDLSEGHLIYLSIIYYCESTMPKFHIGLNLVCLNPAVSKEILLLPSQYWTREWDNLYWKKEEETNNG